MSSRGGEKTSDVLLRSWEGNGVLDSTKTFEERAVEHLSSITSPNVCSLHAKNYAWPIKSEWAYGMPSRNPSRNSGSEETISWKLPILRDIKKKCFFKASGFVFLSTRAHYAGKEMNLSSKGATVKEAHTGLFLLTSYQLAVTKWTTRTQPTEQTFRKTDTFI